MRQNIKSGAKWEDIVGYSRAVRVGNLVEVAGTTAVDENGEVTGDAGTQAYRTLQKIEAALAAAGAKRSDVVRTRIFVTNIERDWQAIGEVHGEFFRHVQPATSMVEVSRLIDDRMLVEIEATAVLSQP